MRMGTFAGCTLAFAACAMPATDAPTARIVVGGTSPLVGIFTRVAADTGVPAELLATMSYVATRLRLVGEADLAGHGGGSGLLGLSAAELTRGAQLAGVTEQAARTDPEASVRAGAALLRASAPGAHTLAEYTASLDPSLAREVTATLTRGVDGHDANGGAVVIAARPDLDHTTPGFGVATQALGYPGAVWYPASSQNYQAASRGVGDIDHIVIHTTQGAFNGTISWFQDPTAQVSAHYVVRSRDGYVAQMVSELNVAWHDACFNARTIGIEHEGYIDAPSVWYTEAMYLESAKLTAYLADKYGIPKTHGPILGHGEAPDCSTHTDPGDGWNWDHYIDLVRTGGAPTFAAGDAIVDAPASLTAGDEATVTVTLTNHGNTAWDLDLTRLGTAAPQDRDSALFVAGDWMSPKRTTGADAIIQPGETGTFTFEIVAPDVSAPVVYDEAFQLVQEGLTWFGPEIHVVVQVVPRTDDNDDGAGNDPGGCAAGPGGSDSTPLATMCGIVAFGAVVRRRRARR